MSEVREYETSILEVANMFLSKEYYDRTALSGMCFLAQAYYLSFYDAPFFEEEFLGGIHGPLWENAFDYEITQDGDSFKYGDQDFEFNFNQQQMMVLDAVRKDFDEYSKYELLAILKTYDCYKDSRLKLQVTDVGNEVIPKEAIRKDFAPLFDFILECPDCKEKVDGKLSTEKRMNIVECSECGNRFIVTPDEEVFVYKGEM